LLAKCLIFVGPKQWCGGVKKQDMTNKHMFFRWNNQGAAHFGFHEMWLLMPDGWHHFTNEGPGFEWVDEGADPEFNPEELGTDWNRI
jgi:hypothetical protein